MRRDHVALVAYLEDRETWVFGYRPEPRMQDCVRWASGSTKALTGRDPLAEFGGVWTTPRGALRVIRRAGGLAMAISRVLTPVATTMAQRGDWGLTEEGAVVVFEGDGLIGLNEVAGIGYVRLPRSAAVMAWSIG